MDRQDQDIARHCRELARCNQRGGRMLSMADLLKAGTLDIDLAAFLIERIFTHADPFIVGARPGGAGKTTVMCALANCVGPDRDIFHAEDGNAIRNIRERRSVCFICHEISPGSYYAYLWGPELREYFSLAGTGIQLATNLHADTLGQAHDQICGDNGVPEERFRKIPLYLFLDVRGSGFTYERKISTVWFSPGGGEHRNIRSGEGFEPGYSAPGKWKDLLNRAVRDDLVTIRQFRELLVDPVK